MCKNDGLLRVQKKSFFPRVKKKISYLRVQKNPSPCVKKKKDKKEKFFICV